MATSPSFWFDGNGSRMATPEGLRPMEGVANIKAAVMGAATAEIDISQMPFPVNEQNNALVRITTDSQGALFAFDKAGQGALYTGIANMTMLPANTVTYVGINASVDKSFYHQQLGVAGNVQLQLMR